MVFVNGHILDNVKVEKSICGKYDTFFAKLPVLRDCFTATNKSGRWEIVQEDVFTLVQKERMENKIKSIINSLTLSI